MLGNSQEHLHRLVLTGPESSGKSTLATALEAHYQEPLVPEFARPYLEQRGPSYGLNDLEEILAGQLALEEMMADQAKQLLICDTGPLVLKIWAEHKFGQCPTSIESAFRERPYALYLLCKPDLPWVPDPLRENPHNRQELFELYLHTLAQYGKNYRVISGADPADRFQQALEAVGEVLADAG
jgi:NadR type nicotinamide-nucleotide adenylyltransferase